MYFIFLEEKVFRLIVNKLIIGKEMLIGRIEKVVWIYEMYFNIVKVIVILDWLMEN